MSESLFHFLRKFVTEDRLRRFDDVLKYRTRHITLVLENIHHAHNASACLRTCDCFGIQDVHIIESQNSFQPNSEIALGASKWLTIHRYSSGADMIEPQYEGSETATAECFQHLRNNGYRILATSPLQNSRPLTNVTVDAKTAIVFGAEQLGVSDMAMSAADELVHIPLFGFTESFNVSVSVALVLQHVVGRLHAADIDWKLPESDRHALLDRWVRQTLGEKLEPLCRRYESDRSL